MSERAVPHVRNVLGHRLRALRKQRGLSQQHLGERARLSTRFLGEVERGQKSISVDSLYRVSVALKVPLAQLTDVREGAGVRSEDTEKVFALVLSRRGAEELRRAYAVLLAMFRLAAPLDRARRQTTQDP